MNLYRQQYCGCIFSEYERYRDTGLHLYRGPGGRGGLDQGVVGRQSRPSRWERGAEKAPRPTLPVQNTPPVAPDNGLKPFSTPNQRLPDEARRSA